MPPGRSGRLTETGMDSFVFPKWTNALRPALAVGVAGGLVYIVFVAAYGASPKTTDVGYAPLQPVEYQHSMHGGELGMDCRYCHNTVERSAHAAIPPTQTCMNCHKLINVESTKLLVVRESYATGMPIEWVRVHDLPDYVYFDHSAHLRAGVGCVSCHGRVDKMDVVYQAETLSMGWCLDCHRSPEQHLRPRESVARMDWMAMEDQGLLGRRLRELYDVNPKDDCSVCHR